MVERVFVEMTKKQTLEELKELILQKAEEGKVVISTIEGLMIADLEEIIKQPTEGLLYDLNRDRPTILTLIDDPKWVNDLAVNLVITKLKEYYDKSQRKQKSKSHKKGG